MAHADWGGAQRPPASDFRVRTLLLATTLVAVVLGLVVWLSR
jgi:hypothetical protein